MTGATTTLKINANIETQLKTAPRIYAISSLLISISVKLQLRCAE